MEQDVKKMRAEAEAAGLVQNKKPEDTADAMEE
jgi:hypothetical protein